MSPAPSTTQTPESGEVMSLSEIAQRANAEYHACVGAASAALLHAVRCGEALLEAKVIVGRGRWEEWLSDNFHAPRQAKPYMRLAYYKDRLPNYETNVREALVYLRGLPSLDGTGAAVPDGVKAEALRLRDAGMSQRQIAQVLGVSKSSVGRWYGQSASDRTGSTRRRLQRERAARAALKKQERLKAAKRTGGSIGVAYSMLRRTADVIDRAITETDDVKVRAALRAALDDIYRADDAIVEAMGWEHGGRRIRNTSTERKAT